MNEFELIKNYFQRLTKNNPSALKLNDDVFFDKKIKLFYQLIHIMKAFIILTLSIQIYLLKKY